MASWSRIALGLFLPGLLTVSGLSGLLCLLALLGGCNEEADLTARVAGPTVLGPDCRTCHGYPLSDTNHAYHLLHTHPDKTVNGPITCLDCHSTALAKAPITVIDTLHIDSIGNRWSSHDTPREPGKVTLADTIRAYPVLRIDTFQQERPVLAPARPGSRPVWEEYVTSLAHMNGKVDVAFHPRVTDTAQFRGAKAAFLPEKETCSAMACHPGTGLHWRFADSAKGLRQLEGRQGDIP